MAIYNDLQLKIALNDLLQEDLARLPAESELATYHVFSKRFERKMQRLIRNARNIRESDHSGQVDLDCEQPASRIHYFPSRRKRLLLTAIILALLLSVLSITAARELVVSFVIDIYEKFTSISFNPDTGTSMPESLPSTADDLKDILPTYLPSGYAQKDLQIHNDHVLVVYANPNGDEILLHWFLSANATMKIDTEGITTELIMVRQAQGIFYSNKGIQSLIWQDGAFAYTLFGIIDKSDMLKMAESTNR